ncbi:MAG TPA: ATP-dependent zinc metalloprotease FtsH [Chthonomonadales bacterium]|nr:ATP-dependent zinc metalloprotease FtsH [Chthonomonadales bacterium]
MNNRGLKLLITAALVVLVVLALQKQTPSLFGDSIDRVSYTAFYSLINEGNVKRGEWHRHRFIGWYLSRPPSARGERFMVELPTSSGSLQELEETLRAKQVPFRFVKPVLSEGMQGLLISIALPIGLLLLLYLFFVRQAQSGGNQALSFGRARAKRLTDSVPKVTFDDVAGVQEAKTELQEIVEFLKNSKKFQALGAKIPKGVLLLGPPGCGKTMLARAVAGEAGVPFFHISGSDFVEMFVGVGASRVRDLFDTAKASRPSLIFIDEIDAVGRQRGAGLGGGHDEREQTLNQLLVEMDGFDPNSGVILIAATNRPDVLDPALLRPGRFDRRVVVDAPDLRGRKEIFRVHLRGKPLEFDLNDAERERVIEQLSKLTPGFTGADIANLVNEAALLAARRDKTRVALSEFEESIDRVRMGPERKSRVMTEEVRRRTAYHEAGHAIVGELLPKADPVHKVSILPRGLALGVTVSLPTEDRYNMTKSEMEDVIAMSLGGRVTEELVYGDMDTGAASDLDHATHMARAMVCEYGMSERLGPLRLGRRHGNPFLGRDLMEDRDYSEDVAKAIDEELRAIIDRNYQRAKQILVPRRATLDNVVELLMQRETLDRTEFLRVMDGETAHPARETVLLPPPPPPSGGLAQPVDEEPQKAPIRLNPNPEPGPA